MKHKANKLQAQFSGFYNTPHLFFKSVKGLQPLVTSKVKTPLFKGDNLENIRLGQRVERFVTAELSRFEKITILAENCQIQTEKKHTIGELDCLYLDEKQAIHLEIQFKFYLYDESLGDTEIDHCIGPMRRDTLNEKLNKLKEKQLPLLYAKETKPLLKSLNFKAEDFIQKIYFKAQIFVPYGRKIAFKTLNNDCIYGFYFSYNELPQFKDCKFYKPQKVDWLLDININVEWQTFEQISVLLSTFKVEKYSPLLWLKFPNGETTKCFVVI